MMFGRRDSFTYLECPDCGSLTLAEVPSSLSDYYPSGYYSLVEREEADQSPASAAIRRSAMALMLRSRGSARALVACGGALGMRVEPWTRLLGGCGLDLRARVLDVGCGDGHRLRTFRRFGFRHLTGTDAHLAREANDTGAIALSRQGMDEVEGVFDLIMFHHSFEHMADPVGVLNAVHRLIAPSGLLLLRLPVAGSWAWRTYGVDWVQLDAPRHQFLYSAEGVGKLAARTGFDLRRTVYDSSAFQFWGSELYRRGTSLQEAGSLDGSPPSTLSRQQLEQWEQQATELNAAGDGDQASFLFTRTAEAGPPPIGRRRGRLLART